MSTGGVKMLQKLSCKLLQHKSMIAAKNDIKKNWRIKMKIKETLKRIVSFATSLAVTSTFLPSLAVHAESPTETVENFPYTLFATSTENGSITINANNVCVNGSIATNGTIESSTPNFNINGSVYENCGYNVPNLISSLSERFFSEDNVESYSEDCVIEDTNINITVPMDVDGTLEFMGNVNISSNITVLNNIIFNGEVENSNDSIICSETGNITIDTTNVNLNGLIYAPNGCVNITAKNLCLNNIIVIADSIIIDCPSFNANYSNHFGIVLGEEIDKARNDLNADFDSDGLTDAYETYIIIKLKLKGINVNGLSDIEPDDDYDNDGLTNIEEYKYGTDPTCDDSDDDGLSDYDEIFTWITNPNYWDTDDDSMSDGTEVACGLDPLNPDSDEDGIADGNEVIEQEVRLSSLNKISDEAHLIPMIAIKGAGDYSRKLDVEDVSYNEAFDDINSLVGHPLDFTHEDLTFEDGTLSFKLDDYILSEHSIDDLTIVWYNYETNEIEFLDTTVVDGSTICAKVDHFSTYGVVDRSWFFNDICWNNDIELTKKGRADIVFAIDTTSSMSDAINKVKLYVNKFAGGLENKDVNYRFGLVEYRDIYEDGINTTVNHGWYNDAESFKTAISKLSVNGGGDQEESAVDALYTARSMKYRPSVNKYIVLITDAPYKDGIRNYPNYTMDDEIKELYKSNFCVSIVSNGYSQYNKLKDTTKGISADINSDFSVSLNGLISKIGTETQGGYWIRLSNGSVVKLDKNPEDGDDTFDTDKDGIPDLIELKRKTIKRVYNSSTGKSEYVTTWSFYSNPAKNDSDGDGLIDIADNSPTDYDIRVISEDSSKIVFNTSNTWEKTTCTAQELFCGFASEFGGGQYPYYHSSIDELLHDDKAIHYHNSTYTYSFDELSYIALINTEGAKFFLSNETKTTRDKIFKTLTGRNPDYYAHVGFGYDEDDWEKVKSYKDGPWYGKVFSESDFNFSLEQYCRIDVLDVIPALVKVGALIIVSVIVINVTPAIIESLALLKAYCDNFGIKDGFGMWYNFGAAGCPDGIVSMIQTDLSDGDTNIDDVILIKSQETVNNKLNNYLLNPEHEHGAPKAKWFKEALGFSRDNMDQLAKQIIFDKNQATPTTLTEYGQKYEQIIKIVGANGREIDVKFAWIINNGNEFASLVTAIPTKK